MATFRGLPQAAADVAAGTLVLEQRYLVATCEQPRRRWRIRPELASSPRLAVVFASRPRAARRLRKLQRTKAGGNHDRERAITREARRRKLSMGFMVRRELKKLPELLGENEDVVNLARGEYDGKEGLIVTTDRRIMFVEQGMIRSNLEDFPYDKVASVKSETGMRSTAPWSS